MTEDDALKFMEELNALLNKYKVVPTEVYGPIIKFRESPFGAGYVDLYGEQTPGRWVFSMPWGG